MNTNKKKQTRFTKKKQPEFLSCFFSLCYPIGFCFNIQKNLTIELFTGKKPVWHNWNDRKAKRLFFFFI